MFRAGEGIREEGKDEGRRMKRRGGKRGEVGDAHPTTPAILIWWPI
jgi:hypothetical protein